MRTPFGFVDSLRFCTETCRQLKVTLGFRKVSEGFPQRWNQIIRHVQRLHILNWNLIDRFNIRIPRSSSIFGTIDQLFTGLCPLDFHNHNPLLLISSQSSSVIALMILIIYHNIHVLLYLQCTWTIPNKRQTNVFSSGKPVLKALHCLKWAIIQS